MSIPKEKLAEIVPALKKEHGDELHLLSAAGEDIIVTSPNTAQFDMFRDYANHPTKKKLALETLTKACVVYPPAAELDALFGRMPGLVTSFGTKLTELAGAVEEVEAKKL